MSENTKIEWCDHTFNPWEGCQKVGPGCDHCYAEARNARFAGGTAINWGPGAPRRRTSASNWNKPRAWNAQADAFMAQHGHRQRVFCASLADWLDNQVDTEWLVDLLEVVRTTPNLDWLLLTKRIGNWRARVKLAFEWVWVNARFRLAELLTLLADWLDGEPPENVWIGATIVNQTEAERDIPKLLEVPAAKRFLSMEPLLGPVYLSVIDINGDSEIYPLRGTTDCVNDEGEPAPDLPALDWVIVGGESGPCARPMLPDWARSLRDQCEAAGVPFLFKQWGEWTPGENVERQRGTVDTAFLVNGCWSVYPLNLATDGGHIDDEPDLYRVGKKVAGRHLDGRTWDGVPA